MLNANVVVVANLLPRKMLGKFDSHGMVLASQLPDKSKIELLHPPEGSLPGDLVFIDGFERKPVEKLSKDPKKNEFFSIADKFKVDSEGTASWDGHVLKTDKGILKATTIRDGIIG